MLVRALYGRDGSANDGQDTDGDADDSGDDDGYVDK